MWYPNGTQTFIFKKYKVWAFQHRVKRPCNCPRSKVTARGKKVRMRRISASPCDNKGLKNAITLKSLDISAYMQEGLLIYSDKILEIGYLSLFVLFLCIVPVISLLIRRFHDMNYSGWFLPLLVIIPLGLIALFIMMCLKGNKYSNKFGKEII